MTKWEKLKYHDHILLKNGYIPLKNGHIPSQKWPHTPRKWPYTPQKWPHISRVKRSQSAPKWTLSEDKWQFDCLIVNNCMIWGHIGLTHARCSQWGISAVRVLSCALLSANQQTWGLKGPGGHWWRCSRSFWGLSIAVWASFRACCYGWTLIRFVSTFTLNWAFHVL